MMTGLQIMKTRIVYTIEFAEFVYYTLMPQVLSVPAIPARNFKSQLKKKVSFSMYEVVFFITINHYCFLRIGANKNATAIYFSRTTHVLG